MKNHNIYLLKLIVCLLTITFTNQALLAQINFIASETEASLNVANGSQQENGIQEVDSGNYITNMVSLYIEDTEDDDFNYIGGGNAAAELSYTKNSSREISAYLRAWANVTSDNNNDNWAKSSFELSSQNPLIVSINKSQKDGNVVVKLNDNEINDGDTEGFFVLFPAGVSKLTLQALADNPDVNSEISINVAAVDFKSAMAEAQFYGWIKVRAKDLRRTVKNLADQITADNKAFNKEDIAFMRAFFDQIKYLYRDFPEFVAVENFELIDATIESIRLSINKLARAKDASVRVPLKKKLAKSVNKLKKFLKPAVL